MIAIRESNLAAQARSRVPAIAARNNKPSRHWQWTSIHVPVTAVNLNVGRPSRSMPGRVSPGDYFCQVRFLWRFARSFLRRLCLLIFDFRRFFSEPIVI